MGTSVDAWLAQLAAKPIVPQEPAYTDHGKVSRETYHDFANYLYVLDPWANRPVTVPEGQTAPQPDIVEPTTPTPSPSPSPDTTESGPPATLDWLEAEAAQQVQTFIAEAKRASVNPNAFNENGIRRILERFLLRATGALSSVYLAPGPVPGRRAQLLFVFIERVLPGLIDKFGDLAPEYEESFFTALDTTVTEWVQRSAILEQPWIWFPFSGSDYRLRSNWEAWGYTIGDTYGRFPSRVPTGNMSYGYTLTQDEEVHLFTFDKELGQIRPYGFSTDYNYGYNVPRPTFFFITGDLYIKTLGQELTRLIALGPVAPPPDPASKWLTDLVSELKGSLLGGKKPKGPILSAKEHYGFKPYPYPSINIGLQIVYRQTWVSKDPGQGELLKTIPLGPGQSEKVSIRRVEREKITRELTDMSATETERESSSKTTISSEIVEEAARSSKWQVDTSVEGSINTGVYGAKGTVSAGYESDSSSSSRDTKKRLNDIAQRTTSKLRRESRVVVTTERERTFETTQTSEIRNPNEELSVTYYYYALQQQYEVKTRLAAVEPVLFVAERMPAPDELTIDWIQRYDWLIGQNLLDESFRDILTRIATLDLDGLKKEIEAKEVEVQALSEAVVQAKASLGALQDLSGNVANTYEGTLKAYQDAVRTALDLARQVQATVRDAQRLGRHLADNILYYMRGIWREEDPDRRRMRYTAVAWPTQFTRVEDSTDEAADGSETSIFGHFVPVPGSEAPLSELIDPTGPIAFAGNYHVFRLRKTALTADLTALIRERQLEFTYQTFNLNPNVGSAELLTPDPYSGEQYTIKLTGNDATLPASYTVVRTPARTDADGEGLSVADAGKTLELGRAAIRIKLSAALAQNGEFVLTGGPLALRDPELSYLVAQRPGTGLDVLEKELEDANTRSIVVDTDNVYLQIDPSPLLETFKQYHRILDVASAFTDVQRRSELLKASEFGDPEIDKVVVVTGATGALAPAGVAIAGDEAAGTDGSPDE